MNQRFKELAEEARLLTGWPVGEVEYQKFAELIVKETLQVARVGIEYGPSMEEATYTYFGINK